jgi:hypothetical protein
MMSGLMLLGRLSSHPVAGDVHMKAGTIAWRETPSTVHTAAETPACPVTAPNGRGRAGQRGLDGSAGPLRASIPTGHGETGFQSTGLLFAGPGCWEVTGRVGDASLSFVTLVVKVAEGPAPRCRALFGGFQPGPQTPTQEHQ